MSADSPTYQCAGGGTPIVDTPSPYCIVPYGHKRMEICCNEVGNHTVNFKPDCYSWCNIDVSPSKGNTPSEDLSSTVETLTYCLTHGDGSREPGGMVCGLGTDDSTNVTVTASGSATPSSSASSQTSSTMPSSSESGPASSSPSPTTGAGVSQGMSAAKKVGLAIGMLAALSVAHIA